MTSTLLIYNTKAHQRIFVKLTSSTYVSEVECISLLSHFNYLINTQNILIFNQPKWNGKGDLVKFRLHGSIIQEKAQSYLMELRWNKSKSTSIIGMCYPHLDYNKVKTFNDYDLTPVPVTTLDRERLNFVLPVLTPFTLRITELIKVIMTNLGPLFIKIMPLLPSVIIAALALLNMPCFAGVYEYLVSIVGQEGVLAINTLLSILLFTARFVLMIRRANNSIGLYEKYYVFLTQYGLSIVKYSITLLLLVAVILVLSYIYYG